MFWILYQRTLATEQLIRWQLDACWHLGMLLRTYKKKSVCVCCGWWCSMHRVAAGARAGGAAGAGCRMRDSWRMRELHALAGLLVVAGVLWVRGYRPTCDVVSTRREWSMTRQPGAPTAARVPAAPPPPVWRARARLFATFCFTTIVQFALTNKSISEYIGICNGIGWKWYK